MPGWSRLHQHLKGLIRPVASGAKQQAWELNLNECEDYVSTNLTGDIVRFMLTKMATSKENGSSLKIVCLGA